MKRWTADRQDTFDITVNSELVSLFSEEFVCIEQDLVALLLIER